MNLTIKIGDYINLKRWYSSVWAEVNNVYISKTFKSLSIYYEQRKSELVYFSSIRKFHRKNDPWDFKEVTYIYTKNGKFIDYPTRTEICDGPIPDEFRYQGTFSIKPWLWNFCGKNCWPKKTKDLNDWLKLHNIINEKIPWNKVYEIINILQTKRIKGWFPICSAEPEQVFDKTFYICETMNVNYEIINGKVIKRVN